MRARERLVRADDQLLRLGDGTDALGQRLCVLGAVTVRDGNALQLRVDGIPAPLSEPLAFTLSPGEEKCFELEPDRGFDAALLRDKRGERLPWYVWITYDGDARAFARIHANPEGLSAP